MNPEIKQKWIEALKSGHYKQGQKQLHPDENRFCCLGVLCDLHNKSTNTAWIKKDDYFLYMESRRKLPNEVMRWAGLHDINDFSRHCWINQLNNSLATLNDEGKSFEEIADVIEKYL